jgi:hypothetical protein
LGAVPDKNYVGGVKTAVELIQKFEPVGGEQGLEEY